VRRIIETKYPTVATEPDMRRKEGSILIDINDFQKKRVDNVRAVAHMMGERARYFKSNIEVDPMSAFERRVIHEFFSDATDLKTESIGFGPSRRVVIKYIGEI
jgi:spoIIIJ-associated protein